MINIIVNFKDNSYSVETNWEETIEALKLRLFKEINNEIIPKLAKLKVEKGPELKNNQCVGDACLAYF